MQAPQVKQEWKRDSFGRVELLDGAQGPIVRRVACGGRIPGSRFIARRLLAREKRALARLGGVVGVARIISAQDAPGYVDAASPEAEIPRARDVLLRSFLPGEPLQAVSALPEDFFERLEDLVGELHRSGVCHNDLHKEPNVLVGADGYPALVDFQLASVHRSFGRSFESRAREDMRHVAKHRRRYERGTGRVSARSGPRRRSLLAALWMRFAKPPYNFVTRRILHVRDGEARRLPEDGWPRWIEAVGPRGRS